MKFSQIAAVSQHRLLLLAMVSITVVSNPLKIGSSQAVAAATTSFVCGKSDGKPATVARTKKGDIPIVIWSSEGFSAAGFTPQVRCQQVSARFQSLYRSGQLKYITAGTLDRIPVVCATKQAHHSCDRQNLLYTLKPDADPQQVIKRLMMIRNRASSRGLEESASTVKVPTTNGTSSIDLNWLNEGTSE
jgi:Circadian oscillating protein COP23